MEEGDRLIALAEHIRRAPHLESSWLDEPSDLLRRSADEAEAAFAATEEASRVFLEHFPWRRAADFEVGIGDVLDETVFSVKCTCGLGAGWSHLQRAPALGCAHKLVLG